MKITLKIAALLGLLVLSSCDKFDSKYYLTYFIASEREERSGGYYFKLIGNGKDKVDINHNLEESGKCWGVIQSIPGFDEIYEEGNEYIITLLITYSGPSDEVEGHRHKSVEFLGIVMKTPAHTEIDRRYILWDP
jgi:hypothetical protein